ncbi:MAG: glycosyltransferase family 2 protein [Vulcanimicrobiota bacterium]
MIAAVIPAYNEAAVIGEVVRGCLEYADTVLVVSDCSSDQTASVARAAGAQVLEHPLQRGAGRATATGLQAALRWGARYIVTLDADGQHLPDEIPRVLEPLKQGEADLVVGCRSINREEMPLIRRLGNRFANAWTWLFLGIAVSDTQSGFRGYTREAATRLPFDARGYEFCSQSLWEAHRLELRIREVPITVVYTEYSQSKGQSFTTSLKTLGRIGREGLRG